MYEDGVYLQDNDSISVTHSSFKVAQYTKAKKKEKSTRSTPLTTNTKVKQAGNSQYADERKLDSHPHHEEGKSLPKGSCHYAVTELSTNDEK